MTQPRGEVFDLGYQHYEGPREGRMRARKALWANGVRTILGLGRGTRAKILPLLLFVAAILPALILALVASQIDRVVGPGIEVDIPSHADYYQIVSIIILLFSAIMAPELLCPDRRDGVIHLYLVRPLTSTDYVAGRWLAFFSITLAIVYSGQVVLLIGFVLAAAEPLDYLRDNWLDIPRFLSAGLVVAVFTTTLPLAVSAFTTRRAYAAAFVIGLFMISHPVANILTGCGEDGTERPGPAEGVAEQCEPLTGDAAKWFDLIDISRVPIRVNDLIFGEAITVTMAEGNPEREKTPTAVSVGWYLLFVAGPGYALWWRYRRIRV